MKTVSNLIACLLLAAAASEAQSITATYLPHGPADPANPAWGPTAYRDIPWWFEDNNPYWADNSLTPGAADAYDISAVYAARLNRNNATGYEAAIINTPAFSHLGTNPYGAPGGAFGSPAESIVWGNGTVWDMLIVYDWNNGSPLASMTFTSGATVHSASASLGSRVTDFVNGTGPYLEEHVLSDVMMRFATVGTYSATPNYTSNSVTVSNLQASLNGDPAKLIKYKDENGDEQTSLTTEWNYVAGADSLTNPRQVEFLVINNLLDDHTDRLELTGQLTFAWTGNAANISQSGLMFELKLGDLDFFPDAAPEIPDPDSWGEPVPEPSSALLFAIGAAWVALGARQRRHRADGAASRVRL